MPLIQVTAPRGSLNKNDQDTLMSRLSNAVLSSERAPVDDPGAQSLVWAYFHEVPEGGCYVGGENLEKAPLRIAVTTPEGALNDGTRKSFEQSIEATIIWNVHAQRECYD